MPSVPTFRTAPHMLEPANDSIHAEPGDVRFRLQTPGLSFEQYLAMQAAMAARHMPKPVIDVSLIWLGGIALVGGGLIAASFALGITSGLSIDVKAWEWSTYLGGGPLVIIVAALMALAYWAAAMRGGPAFLAYAATLHAEGRDLFGPQDLTLTGDGLICVNGTGRHFVRWGAITDLILDQGTWYLIIQGGAAVWIPEETIRGRSDADSLRDFLKRKAPARQAA